MDPSLIWTFGWQARFTVLCGIAVSALLGTATSNSLCQMLDLQSDCINLRILLPVFIALTGSPMFIQQATEMKLGTTKVGQLGCSVALLNGVACPSVMAPLSRSPVLALADGYLLEPFIALLYPLLAYVIVGPCVGLVMRGRRGGVQLVLVMAMVRGGSGI
ncbi:hypothetical protein AMTR_s00068p00108670 [Amborella trichopoda]|uniref:Cation/H+ exchanger domain-containing protein n=1 Tax=Amborella trichopoda TaxID=13333 RepID=U5DG22_AMBTC|nr:hypothetical protein AMTR_s00068p00108670 [Amborella trichopoda]